MDDISVSLVFGIALALLGGFLFRWHLRAWREHRDDGTLAPHERQHYRWQLRRRLQVSVLLIVLGVLIPLGDWLMMQRRQPGLIAGFWIVVLLITFWIMILAALDWLSTRMHVRAARGALQALNRKRRELEEEVARLRSEHRNGSD